VIRATGATTRPVIQVHGSGGPTTIPSSMHNITDAYVPVGANSFNVDATTNLAVGQTVVVFRPSPSNWIHDIGMDLLINPWMAGSKNLWSYRVITAISGSTITLDAPITNSLDQNYGGGKIWAYTWPGRVDH